MGSSFRSELARFAPKVGATQAEETAELRRILATATMADVLSIAREIEADGDQLARTAAFAYRHTNGFRKITLFRSDACCLRVHIWDDGASRAENIHNHRWGFASRVLAGTVSESRFELAGPGRKADEFGYVRAPGENFGSLERVREVELAQSGELVHGESSLYSMTTPEIHRINDDHSGALITLVLTGSRREPRSLVYSAVDSRPIDDRTDNTLSVGETRQSLRNLAVLS